MKKKWLNEKGEFVELTEDQLKEVTEAADLGQYHKALRDHKDAEMQKLITENDEKNIKRVKELDGQIKALTETTIKGLQSALEAQGIEMKRIVAEIDSKVPDLNMKEALLKSMEGQSDEIIAMAKSGVGTIKFEVKASQTAADITSGTDFALLEPGVGQIPTRQPFLKELFNVQNVSKEYIKYNDQETIVRDAKNVAGCAVSTHLSKVTWEVRTLQISKVRDFVDVCVDMIDDYDFVEGEIRTLVETNVKLKVDSQLLLGTGIDPELNSVSAVASTFAATDYALAIPLATLIDLVCVGSAQIKAFGQENAFTANWILMNPVDAKLMKLTKDVNGNYVIPNFITSTGMEIDGVRVLTNPLVPANEAYIGDFSKGTVFQNKNLTIAMSFENNDNFEREIVTVKAYERLNLRVRNNDANAFMHFPDLAAGVTAITKP